MTTSRERVLAAFSHTQADRVPSWCGASDEFWDKAKKQLALDDEGLLQKLGDDFRRVRPQYNLPDIPFVHPEATCRTVFGIERSGLGYGQPLDHPLANATLKDVENYPWPNPNCVDVSLVKDQALKYNGQYAILGGDWSPFWHDIIDLFGMEELFIKMYTDPEVIDAALEKMIDFYADVNLRLFDAAADAIDIFFIGNDFGSQTGPLMSPKMFKRFMVPHLKRLTDLGHGYGLKTQLHCCGAIYQLIPDIIDAGFDSLHALQPDCKGMDLKKIKADFGDKIVLNGGIDSKSILIDSTPEQVKEKTLEILQILAPEGGYIAGASHDTILEETPVENVVAMFEAVKEFKI